MALSAPVGLSGEDSQKCAFTMPAKATNLNRYGAAIHLPRQLLVGSTVNLRNSRGTQLSARVVALLAVSREVSAYGIEFIEPGDVSNGFWGRVQGFTDPAPLPSHILRTACSSRDLSL
jgi:hypothetical protein